MAPGGLLASCSFLLFYFASVRVLYHVLTSTVQVHYPLSIPVPENFDFGAREKVSFMSHERTTPYSHIIEARLVFRKEDSHVDLSKHAIQRSLEVKNEAEVKDGIDSSR